MGDRMQAIRKVAFLLATLPLLVLLPIVAVCLMVVFVSVLAGYVPKPLAELAHTEI